MRIAVTGGTGKLGRAVVAGLRESGDQVFNLDAAAQRPDIRVDLTDYGQTLSALTAVDDRYSAIDAVVHLAGETVQGRWTSAKKARIRDSRVLEGVMDSGLARRPLGVGRGTRRPRSVGQPPW